MIFQPIAIMVTNDGTMETLAEVLNIIKVSIVLCLGDSVSTLSPPCNLPNHIYIDRIKMK